MTKSLTHRQPEPEWMDVPEEAAAYAQADFTDVNAAFVDRLIEIVGDADPAVVVDLGTGPADIPRLIAVRRPHWRIVASDVSWAMLSLRKRPDPRRMMCVRTNVKGLPLADGGADGIFTNTILHHMPDPAPLWREVRRVLRPGGWIFFRDLARPATDDAAKALVETYAGGESELLQEEYYRSLLAAFTPEEVLEQLHAAGLTTLQVAMASDRHLDIWGRL